jgi:hypothetical protein
LIAGGEQEPVVKFQSYLAGSAFALLLFAHIGMALLDAYPVNQYLWHVNIVFAREARPLLEHLDMLAGGSSAITILALSGLALLSIAAAKGKMRLLAAANCHIALAMLLIVATRSYQRTYLGGAPVRDRLASLFANLSFVQYGIIALIVVLLAVCLFSHVQILRRGLAARRRRTMVTDQSSPTGQV